MAILKKIYVVYPLFVLFAWILAVISLIISKIAMLFIPLLFYFWVRNRKADIWMEHVRGNERVIFFFLKNKEVLRFVGEKISEELVKIKDKAIRVLRNTMYVYAGKPVLIARQGEDVAPRKIYELREKAKFKPGIIKSRAFLKCMGMPLMAFILSFALPSSAGCVLIMGCSFVPLVFAYLDGALEFASSPSRDEILCFYFSGARTIQPVTAKLRSEGYADMPGHGKLRLADNTDYFLGMDKLFLCSRGVNHSFNLDVAEKAMWFRRIGLHDKYDLKEGLKMVDRDLRYDSFEEKFKAEGNEFIKECKKRGDGIRKKLQPEAIWREEEYG